MVTIVASYNVIPNQATPKDPLWLSDSDQIGSQRHVSTIYIYKSKHKSDTIESLRNSLGKILVHYYPVAGRLSLAQSGRMEVDCNAKGVTLLEAETTKTFDDYGDFSPSESTEELVPKVDYTTHPIEEIPLLLVQITRFQGGEGLALGVALSHPLVDGISAVLFINRWAKMARGEELEPKEIPFLDRTILNLARKPSAPSTIKLPEWKPVPLTSDQQKNKTSAALLKLSSTQVEKLKKKANNKEESSKEGAIRPYSRFETIAAHIWRSASRARGTLNEPTQVRFSVDIRNRLNPPLPQNYFGNALAKAVTDPKCCEGEITSKPLSFAAQKIREAAHAVNDEYVRSQISVIFGQEQLDSIRGFFMGQGNRMKVPYSGNHNILLASWMSMPVYDADFGWGKPVHFGSGNLYEEDKAKIMLSSDGDGVVVCMNLQTQHMELFRKCFYEDI